MAVKVLICLWVKGRPTPPVERWAMCEGIDDPRVVSIKFLPAPDDRLVPGNPELDDVEEITFIVSRHA